MGAGGKGRGYLSPGKALMKSLWSLLWLSSTRVLFKSDQHLSEDTPSFPLTSHLQPLPLDFLPFVSLSPTTASFHCCYPLLPFHQPPFTSCPPLWSGHGSCLYLTNRGGPIPLAPRHLKLVMWCDVWKAVCTCVVSKGHVCISAFFLKTFRNTHASLQHSGTDSDSLSIIPRHWYYSVISAKWLRGQLYCCPPINPTLLCASSSPFFRSSSPSAFSSSSSLFTQPQAKRSSILHCGGLLSYSMTSCLERSIKAMCYQKECILFCIWFAFELGGSELQRAVLWMWYKQS